MASSAFHAPPRVLQLGAKAAHHCWPWPAHAWSENVTQTDASGVQTPRTPHTPHTLHTLHTLHARPPCMGMHKLEVHAEGACASSKSMHMHKLEVHA